MRIIQLQLYVLMWCQAAETVDQLTDFGQNVTINCTLDKNEVYWVLLKQSDSITIILQSLSITNVVFHFDKTFKNKYSIQSKHRLVIKNVTVNELGVYYCMNTGMSPKLSTTTRLHINEPTPNSYTEFPVTEKTCTQWKTFTLISGLLIGVLIITVLGLLKVCDIKNGCWKKSGNGSEQLDNTDLRQTQVIDQHQDPKHVQYAAVDFSKLRKSVQLTQDNSTYAAVKLPRPRVPEYE